MLSVVVIIVIIIAAICIINVTIIEQFGIDSDKYVHPYSYYPPYDPLAAFVTAVVAISNNKLYNNDRHNLRTLFNEFTSGQTDKLNGIDCNTTLVKQFIKNIEKRIPSNELIFYYTGEHSCYSYKYAKDFTFIKVKCIVILKDLQMSNNLETAEIPSQRDLRGLINKYPVDVYAVIHKDNTVILSSVNGYKVESDIVRYSDPSAENNWYSAQMFRSNLDDSSQFGGYQLLTPDKDTLKKFCKQRRDELNEYSYCEITKVNNDGSKNISHDQTVDEVKCIAKGGKIVRIHTPKFGLLFDNLDAITEDINGNIEINDMYIGESDMCADLSLDEEESSDINTLFNQERKYAKIVSNYLK